jgi:hypothetical protein
VALRQVASRLANDARQGELAALELAQREAASRPRKATAAPWFRDAKPKETTK